MNKTPEDKFKIHKSSNATIIHTGKFKIMLPEISGFCGGVISALKKLESVIASIQQPKQQTTKPSPSIFLLGEVIHNSTVNQDIASVGVKIIPESKINTVFKIAKEDDYVVIPAFGIPLALEKKIRNQYKNIVDTTCKNVKSVWNFISSEAEKGSTILLYGKPGHPEVKASISRAGKLNCVIILPSLDSAKHFAEYLKKNAPLKSINNSDKDALQKKEIFFYNYRHFNPKRLALANQTTMLYNEAMEVEHIIKEAISTDYSKLIACNTICTATYLRQQAAIKVCKQKPDLIIVVGGYDSSNTAHLYELAEKYTTTYYIKDADSIDNSKITHFLPRLSEEIQISTQHALKDISAIAILAGASCPFTVISKIIKKLETIG